MDHIVITGVHPFDGRWPFDLAASGFTTREWGWMKRLSGYLPATLADGYKNSDPELFACWAVIALHRARKITTDEAPAAFDRLIDAEAGSSIQLEASSPEEEMPSDPTASSNGNATSSGDDSTTNSEKYGLIPAVTGTSDSATSGLVSTRLES